MIEKISEKEDIKRLKDAGATRFLHLYEKIDEIIEEVNKLKKGG